MMAIDTSVQVALVSAGASVILGLGAIFGNARILSNRIEDLGKRMDRIERTLEVIQSDLKEFYKDLTRLKTKANLE